MKSSYRFFGIIILTAIMVFSFTVCDTGGGNPNTPLITMIYVEGGSFDRGKEIGTASTVDETPVYPIKVNSFYMSATEVTQEQWYKVMGTTIQEQEAITGLGLKGVGNNYPMYYVNWYEAVFFCNRLSILEGKTPVYSKSGQTDTTLWGAIPDGNSTDWNANITMVLGATGYRLPTEAEWEYAAKGGSKSGDYTYSGSDTPGDVAWYDVNAGGGTNPVKGKAANQLGLYDMSGNVSEWCWDWQGAYTITPVTDPTGASSGTLRVGRGGYWNNSAGNLRSVYRSAGSPNLRDSGIGFRVLCP